MKRRFFKVHEILAALITPNTVLYGDPEFPRWVTNRVFAVRCSDPGKDKRPALSPVKFGPLFSRVMGTRRQAVSLLASRHNEGSWLVDVYGAARGPVTYVDARLSHLLRGLNVFRGSPSPGDGGARTRTLLGVDRAGDVVAMVRPLLLTCGRPWRRPAKRRAVSR